MWHRSLSLRLKSRFFRFLGYISAASVLGTQANATDYNWVGPNLGSWNVNSNWNPSTNFPSSAQDSAIFSGGPNIQVDVNGSFSVGSMVFSNGAYTISPSSGGTLSIGGVGSSSPQISVTTNNNESISTPLILQSAVTISQTGTGTLSLSGGISGNSSSYMVTIAGTGIVESFSDTYPGNTTINANAYFMAAANDCFTPNNDHFIIDGTLDLNNYPNTLHFIEGTGSIFTGASGTGILTLNNGGSFAGSISGAGGITVAGFELALGNTGNTYSGPTTVNVNCAIILTANNALSSSSAHTINGTLFLSDNSATIYSLFGSGSITADFAPAILTISNGGLFSGSISEVVGLVLTNNTLQLSGAGSNAYSGSTTINNSATLTGAALNALSPNSAIVLNDTGTLSLNANNEILSLTSASAASSVNLGSYVLTISSGGSFSGSISGSGGGLSLTAGTLSLTGANSYTGLTTINNGADLQLSGGATFSSSGSMDVEGTLDIQSLTASSLTIADISGSSSGLVLLGSKELIFGTGNSKAFAGGIQGTGPIQKEGSGTWTLQGSGLNTYSGPTTIVDGSIYAYNSNALPLNSDFSVNSGATLIVGNFSGNTIKSLSGSGSVLLDAASSILTISDGGSFSGSISGDGGLSISQNSFTLTGTNNSYFGPTTINGSATLIGGNLNSLSPNSAITLNDTSQLILDADNVIAALSGSSNTIVDLRSFILTVGGGQYSSIFGGKITNLCGGLTITGGNSLTLSGPANDYCGNTLVENGILTIAANGALSPNTNVTVDPDGTLNLGTFANNTLSLTSSGTVSNQGQVVIPSILINGGQLSNTGNSTVLQGDNSGSSTIVIAGGSVTNGNLGPSIENCQFGNLQTSILFTGGTIYNNAQILCSSYTQGPSASLHLGFFGPIPLPSATIEGSGAISLDGALVVDFTDASQLLNQMDTLISGNHVTGTFSSVSFQNYPNSLVPSIIYTPTSVQIGYDITVGPNSMGSLTQFLSFITNSANFLTERDLYDLHNRIKNKKTLWNDYLAFNDIENSDVSFLRLFKRKQSQLPPKIKEKPKERACRVYIGPIGSFGDFHSLGNIQTGFDYSSIGVAAGSDYAFSQAGLGIAANYSQVSARSRHQTGNFDLDQIRVCSYGSWVPFTTEVLKTQPFALNAIIGYGFDWYTVKRTLLGSWKATGSPSGSEFDAMFGAEYLCAHDQIASIPDHFTIASLFNVQYVYVQIDKFREHGGGIYNMKVTLPDANFVWSTIGTRLDYQFIRKNVTIKHELDIGWQYQYVCQHDIADFFEVQAPWPVNVSMPIAGFGRNVLWIGADLLATIYETYQIEASYDLQFNNHFINNSFYLGLGAEF